jgi:hypothetical protein
VWDDSIIWCTNVAAQMAALNAQTIVWDEDTIVWDESTIYNNGAWEAQ